MYPPILRVHTQKKKKKKKKKKNQRKKKKKKKRSAKDLSNDAYAIFLWVCFSDFLLYKHMLWILI